MALPPLWAIGNLAHAIGSGWRRVVLILTDSGKEIRKGHGKRQYFLSGKII